MTSVEHHGRPEDYRPPRDGVARLFTVYGYERDTTRPQERGYTLEPSVTFRLVNPSTPERAEEVRDIAVEERPELAWVIEWRRL